MDVYENDLQTKPAGEAGQIDAFPLARKD